MLESIDKFQIFDKINRILTLLKKSNLKEALLNLVKHLVVQVDLNRFNEIKRVK
jgi:hypothetical protein